MNCVAELKKDVGITDPLGRKGVKSSVIPDLSLKAVKDACILTNPRKASKRDIEVVFEEAM